jgi:hypothetical protein
MGLCFGCKASALSAIIAKVAGSLSLLAKLAEKMLGLGFYQSAHDSPPVEAAKHQQSQKWELAQEAPSVEGMFQQGEDPSVEILVPPQGGLVVAVAVPLEVAPSEVAGRVGPQQAFD